MLKRVSILLLVFLVCIPMASAQDSTTNKQLRTKERADLRYDEYSFSPAIDIYKKVMEKGFVSADLLKRLGDSYYYNAKYKEASEIYKKMEEAYLDEMEVEDIFKYAQSLKTIGNYGEANRLMRQFKEMTTVHLKFDEDYMDRIEENSGRYTLSNFEHNSKYSDFAPSFYRDGLIIASDRDTGNLARYRHTWNAHDLLDLYKVNVDEASQNRAVKLSGEVNSRLHESSLVVTKDSTTLYFTRNNFLDRRKEDKDGIIRLKIYKAENINGYWTNIEELPINSDSYSVAHPMLSPDEKKLYFASDMPGSLGKSDLFVTDIIGDGTYGPIVNLGHNINTMGRETFPFITDDGILYFSSNGHQGLGGLDIFATKI